ncbi:MAG: DUF4082 domain-containing protein, partial [Frankiaceae bacterium]
GVSPARAAGPCGPPVVNPVACENSQPGAPASQWDVSGAGSSTIQGFATDISVNVGQTVHFKIKTPARSYRLDVYRMGYYQGLGARLIAGNLTPTATLPQTQPACTNQTSTGLIDCGNWAESASWAVPTTAVSGIYFAKLTRTDGTSGSSHIVFVVRDDASHSNILYQTSDTTWQAYNNYGGNSLYTGSPAGRAYKVSYNRPFNTRSNSTEDFVFNAEYPMVRFLERNGYDVSYSTGVDSDRHGDLIKNHRLFMSSGHDEYWSGGQRANVQAARDAGVNLAFFSGNEVFWKTRWEGSIAGPATDHRTIVCYKETHANAVIDPADPPTWTGTWRDPRFSPPADGGRPENALTGTIFMVNGERTDAIQVPSADGRMRLWRNTSIATLAAGATATLPTGTLGYEWDEDLDNGSRPAGLIDLSTTTLDVSPDLLQDYGSTYGNGTATHHLTLYRAASGALVFGAGTVQWSWGLDGTHDRTTTTPDVRMQQATVNLLADMGVQPGTLMSGLTAAAASTDTVAPTTTITAPSAGDMVQAGSTISVTGTATDSGGGTVGGVEVSTDGGTSWHPAAGRGTWSYSWRPTNTGQVTIKARAADDSANIGAVASVTVTVGARSCPCTIFGSATPSSPSDSDTSANELGVKFRADTSGIITGLRFYKGAGNTGTHVGHLWSRTGTLLASATFTGETASGWQQVNFSSPVAVSANTTYVASYHTDTGHYAEDDNFFAASAYDSAPLHALAAGTDGPNGVYASGASAFPTQTYQSANYYVDVVFASSSGSDTTPPTVTSVSPAAGTTGVATGTTVKATFSEPVQAATITTSTFTLQDAAGATVPATVAYDSASQTATLTPSAALAASTLYTAQVSSDVKDIAGNPMAAPFRWSFTTGSGGGPNCPCSIWSASSVPQVAAESDAAAVEVGLKWRSDVAGSVTGVRFYKAAANTGTHVGSLWSSTGTKLASATFTGETASGWQQVTFATPVSVAANTTYVVSYHTNTGHYSDDTNFFASAGVDNAPLHALADGVDGANGVYSYGSSSVFPTNGYQASNYWVDVVFSTTP